jgi:hypothetical protein
MHDMTTAGQAQNKSGGCGCQDAQPAPVDCCSLICFERPNYFCGHLLTGEDLSLEQKYFLEKNKLRNRALTGNGVVCGLRLTCDTACGGYIRIDAGYAIDDCGNDLVACEPVRFNVLGTLEKKRMLLAEPRPDPCGGDPKPEPCAETQCFYIVACYEEENAEFTTPFQPGCASGPAACEPTRVKERVRFDVVDTLPKRPDYLANLERRIAACFTEFSSGALGRKIKENVDALLAASEGRAEFGGQTDYCKIFCQLQAQFLHYLKLYPSRYSCDFEKEVRVLSCPQIDPNRDQENQREQFPQKAQEAFCVLITLIERYQNDCALGELVFECPSPCGAGCVVLGAVEVYRGRLVRVCNTPRWYIWSFASFWQVLMYSLLTGALRARAVSPLEPRDEGARKPPAQNSCCPNYQTECREFLHQFRVDQNARFYAARSAMAAAKSVRSAMERAFSFTDTRAFSPEILANLKEEELPGVAGDLGISFTVSDLPERLTELNFMQAFLGKSLMRPHDASRFYRTPGAESLGAVPDFFAMLNPDRSEEPPRAEAARRITELEAQLQDKIKALSDEVGELRRKVDQGGNNG